MQVMGNSRFYRALDKARGIRGRRMCVRLFGRKLSAFLGRGLAATAALVMVASVAAAANDGVFTVGNYPVDATAENAVTAKRKAMADGQEAALRSLLKRLVSVNDYGRLKRLSGLKASDFLEGVSVRSERNSRTRYIASLDFAFRPESVRSVLQQEGIPFVEDQAREIIVVPVVRKPDGSFDKGTAAKVWSDTWKSLDLEHSLTPFSVQPLKEAIPADAVTRAAEGGNGAERVLAGEYGSPYVVLAIAESDQAAKKLGVTLSGIDAVGDLSLKRTYKVFDGDMAYSLELAAVIGLGVLEGRWKARKLPAAAGASIYAAPAYATTSSGAGTPVVVRAQYGSLGEWTEMRRQLLSLPGLENLQIGAESARGADLSMSYPGGAEALASALYSRGLMLQSGGNGLILRSGN